MGFTVGAGGGALADGAVTTDKIDDGAVTIPKLDATGTPGASTFLRGDGAWEAPDGANAYPWQSITQASASNSLELTGLDGDVFEVVGQITSNSANSATEIEFNGSSGGYTYRHHYSGGVDANAGGYFPPGLVGSGVTCYFHGIVQRTGTTIHADLNVSLPASALNHAVVYKAITGATNINALRIFSNQANGIGAGSTISARKVR